MKSLSLSPLYIFPNDVLCLLQIWGEEDIAEGMNEVFIVFSICQMPPNITIFSVMGP